MWAALTEFGALFNKKKKTSEGSKMYRNRRGWGKMGRVDMTTFHCIYVQNSQNLKKKKWQHWKRKENILMVIICEQKYKKHCCVEIYFLKPVNFKDVTSLHLWPLLVPQFVYPIQSFKVLLCKSLMINVLLPFLIKNGILKNISSSDSSPPLTFKGFLL